MAIRGPKQADREIGARLKALRISRGLNQTDLARPLGLTFQQIQKYEKGSNRVAISTGLELCRVLDVKLDALLPTVLGDGTPIADPFIQQAQSIRGVEVARLFGELDKAEQASVLSIVKSIVAAKRAATEQPRLVA